MWNKQSSGQSEWGSKLCGFVEWWTFRKRIV